MTSRCSPCNDPPRHTSASSPLAAPAPAPRSRSRVVLVRSPGGTKVIDLGFSQKIRDVTARWRHDVPTKEGSSGGAFFNQKLELIGIHQGEFDTVGRFVPLERFVDPVLEVVRKDIAPETYLVA